MNGQAPLGNTPFDACLSANLVADCPVDRAAAKPLRVNHWPLYCASISSDYGHMPASEWCMSGDPVFNQQEAVMSQATDVLRQEHDAILVALQILERMADAGRRGLLPPGDAERFLGFLKDFVDTCHHGKEEGILFPAMIAAGVSEKEGPVALMLADHAQGRSLVAAMAEAMRPSFSPDRFAEAAARYVSHLRAHIQKENGDVFPMADIVVPQRIMDTLAPAFDRHELEVMGPGRHEQLHAMLKSLKALYLDG